MSNLIVNSIFSHRTIDIQIGLHMIQEDLLGSITQVQCHCHQFSPMLFSFDSVDYGSGCSGDVNGFHGDGFASGCRHVIVVRLAGFHCQHVGCCQSAKIWFVFHVAGFGCRLQVTIVANVTL